MGRMVLEADSLLDSSLSMKEMARKVYLSEHIHYTLRILTRIYNQDGLSTAKMADPRWEFGGDTVVDANKYLLT
jgi:hypothetical protein